MAQKNHQKIRVGIVGAGNIVRQRHLPALKEHPEVEIVAVSNSSYESAEKFCGEHIPQATPMRNWADLVALPDIDVVWIGTPPYLHSAVTISALESGKHVFCQARMSMDLVEAEEMLAAAKRFPDLVTMLCPPPYGLRGDLLVKKLLADERKQDDKWDGQCPANIGIKPHRNKPADCEDVERPPASRTLQYYRRCYCHWCPSLFHPKQEKGDSFTAVGHLSYSEVSSLTT